jgi:cytochrome c556
MRAHLCGALLVFAAALVVRAQQPPAAPPKPLVPVAASTLADSPEAFYGQYVSVFGIVEQALSSSAFSIDQDATRTGKDVLVVAPVLTAPVDLNAYVTVVGEVVRFDDEIASRSAAGLAPEIVARYRGRPAVLATAVVNAALVDLAKRLPAPLTPEEASYDAVMKRIGPAFAALRQAVTGSDAAALKEQAAILKKAFGETQSFWKTRNRADATQWAADGLSHSEAIERAAARADWEAIKSSATNLGQACQNCHGAYRERLEDGSYRIRALQK